MAGYRIAQLGVIAAALAILYLWCGPWTALLDGIALMIAWAIILLLTTFIKQPATRNNVSLVLLVVLAGLLVGEGFYRTNPKHLFQVFIAKPMPPSVRILECEYQHSRDSAVYLHFQLSSNDLDAILLAKAYQTSSDTHGPMGGNPAWWKPESLKNAAVYYWEDTQQPGNAAWLWVNDAKTEAYFTHWNF
jgi:hypothetical protein